MFKGNVQHRLLELLVSLPNVDTVAGRRALVMNAGIEHLARYITWEGNTQAFFTGLLQLLADQGQEALLCFLDGIEASNIVGMDRVAELHHLRNIIKTHGWLTEISPERSQVTAYLMNLKKFIRSCLKRERIMNMPIELRGTLGHPHFCF